MEKEFRAWDGREMIAESNCRTTPYCLVMDLNGKYFDIAYGRYDDGPVDFKFMQYTGLKDKDDKKIFEGDILNYGMVAQKTTGMIVVPGRKILTTIKLTFVVNWEYPLLHQISQIVEGDTDLEHVEIIGNIYENKDILENLNNAGNN